MLLLAFLSFAKGWKSARTEIGKKYLEEQRKLDTGCGSSDPDYDNSIELSSNLLFFWSVESDDILNARMVYDGVGWVAFGVSSDGLMVGSEAVIGLPDMAFENQLSVMKFDLDSKGLSGVVPMEDNMQTLMEADITQENEQTVLTFKKKLKEDGEKEILATGTNSFLWAVGSTNTLGHHKQRGVFHLDLSNCESITQEAVPAAAQSAAVSNTVKYNMKAFIAHGMLAAFAWSVAAPFAVSTAWFRRLVPTGWIYMHVLANVSCFFLTLVAFIVAVAATSVHPEADHFTKTHHVVGLVIMILVTLQVMGGFMRPPIEKVNVGNPESMSIFSTTPRRIWHLTHRGNGLLLLILSVFQIRSGLILFSNRFGTSTILPLYWTTVVIFIISVVVIKASMVCNFRKDQVGPSSIFATSDEVEFSNPHNDMT